MVAYKEITDFSWAGRVFSFSDDSLASLEGQNTLDLQLFNEDLDNDDLEGENENELYDEEMFNDISLTPGNSSEELLNLPPLKSVVVWSLASEAWIIALVLNCSSIFKAAFCDLAITEHYNWKFAAYMFKSKFTCVLKMLCTWVSGGSLLSLSSIIPATEWAEREAWDMNGVFFVGSWDLRRILTDYGFRFFPMLKQVPLSGYTQCVYDDYSKVVTYELIELSQGFRA